MQEPSRDHPTRHGPAAVPEGGVNGSRSGLRESGAALFVAVVSIMIASTLSMGMLVLAVGRSGHVRERMLDEAALACAEAGLDRGIAEANRSSNRNNPAWPLGTSDIVSGTAINLRTAELNLAGTFAVRFVRGEIDGVDNDGNGIKDAADAGERRFLSIESTGNVNGRLARVRGQVELMSIFPEIEAAVFIDDLSPDLQLGNSVSYRVDGRDHDMYSDTVVAAGTSLPAFATTGTFPAADVAKINAKSPTQINGTVPPYGNGYPDNIDIDALIAWGQANADHVVNTGGVNPPGPFGTPASASPHTEPVFEVTYHDVGAKFTGNKQGAGIWIVNGDLEIGGALQFTGIIIVKGKVSFNGGGPDNHLTGALITSDAPAINFDANGTIDILYSSAAVSGATNSTARYSLRSWREEAP